MIRGLKTVAILGCVLAGAGLVARGVSAAELPTAPADHQTVGGARFGAVGDANRDVALDAFALDAGESSGSVTFTVKKLDPKAGRWYRFSFRGLPQANFVVKDDDLTMKAAFFGGNGEKSYDAKEVQIYDAVETARKDISVNGMQKKNGAEVWKTYTLDFRLPFPEVDEVKLTVGFGHGSAKGSKESAFLVDSMLLTPIPDPPDAPKAPAQAKAIVPTGKLIPLGGRWFYAAVGDESAAPKTFTTANADRLLYKDSIYSAPFAGNTSAMLRAGFKDINGQVVTDPRMLDDNVTIEFTEDAMAIHTHSVPNHPTGRFPEIGRGNPSYIGERLATYYFPLNPQVNPTHRVTDKGNANGALHMGPIGLAMNGVVFFNPFDMGNQDAADLMDRCCGHPNQMNQYHYHKYPVCVNTPWSDDGTAHSPVLGWAFDGYPVYGPYESAGVMAKDIKGKNALNGFNLHEDEERGPHYHVTPGQFPYLIGGFWGIEDARNARRGPPGGPGGGPGGPGGGMREGGGRGPGGRGPGGPGGRDGNRPPPPIRD